VWLLRVAWGVDQCDDAFVGIIYHHHLDIAEANTIQKTIKKVSVYLLLGSTAHALAGDPAAPAKISTNASRRSAEPAALLLRCAAPLHISYQPLRACDMSSETDIQGFQLGPQR
jgi:hypothetical protein